MKSSLLTAPALLDTCEPERAPHVREFIDAAVRLGGVIQSTEPGAARQRDADMLAKPQNFVTPQPRFGPGAHGGGELAGCIGEQPLLDAVRRIDAAAGHRHALLLAPALAVCEIDAGDVALIDPESPAAVQWLARLGAQAVLLRSDRYVAGTAHDATELAVPMHRHRIRRAIEPSTETPR